MADLVPVTDVTKTIHHDVYPAVAPTRPELTQAGRTVLITGGGTGIGKAIAKAFALAAAKSVLILGRRADVLDAAVAELQAAAAAAASPTVYRAFGGVDVASSADVDGLWDRLAREGVVVDVLVQNAAVISEPKSLLDLGIDAVWHQFEVNVKGPLHLAERFQKQGGGQKFMINISTVAIHMTQNQVVACRPAYPLTKASTLFAASLIADSVKPESLQVVSFHPGLIYTPDWGLSGITEDMLPFDNIDLAGALAVWAASSEAAFLHGRYFINNWDVTELREVVTKAALDANPDLFRLAIAGLSGVKRTF